MTKPKSNHKPKPLRHDSRDPTPSQAPSVVYHDMRPARVLKFDSRRGCGAAVLTSGKRVRIPWSALRGANVATLSPGDTVFVQLDSIDKARVEVIRLPDGP